MAAFILSTLMARRRAPFQQTLEHANIQTHTTDDDLSPLGQDEVDLISGVHAKNLANGSRNRDPTLAAHGGGGHCPENNGPRTTYNPSHTWLAASTSS